MPSRREFLRVGLAGATVLAAARFFDRPAAAGRFRFLDESHAPIVAAFAPVVLAGSIPAQAKERGQASAAVVDAFDRAVSGLAPAVQEEIRQLLSLLAFAPTRVAFAGLWTPVPEASPAQLEALLARWRSSRFDLHRASYHALTQLIQASWYGQPPSWPAIGYPGPPALGT